MANGDPELIVLGSHAPGLFLRVERIPAPGETVIGWDFKEPIDGGKGSNQAIAAARLGARTSFVGCVGQDRLGEEGEKWMRAEGVDLRFLLHSTAVNTGVGFIILDSRGVPAMVTSMGANAELTIEHVDFALSNLQSAKVLLTQFEIPVKVALHAAWVGQKFGMITIINPAPAVKVSCSEMQVADILVPNESEAKELLGIPQSSYRNPLEMAAELIEKSKSNCVIITMGEQGIVGMDSHNTWRAGPPPTEVVDTSGAGDVFCAALAVRILRGDTYKDASEWACKAAALSVTKPGTIPAFPYIQEVIG